MLGGMERDAPTACAWIVGGLERIAVGRGGEAYFADVDFLVIAIITGRYIVGCAAWHQLPRGDVVGGKGRVVRVELHRAAVPLPVAPVEGVAALGMGAEGYLPQALGQLRGVEAPHPLDALGVECRSTRQKNEQQGEKR